MKAKVITLTPATAKQYLENNKANRPMSQQTVNFYVNEMRAGRWKENGESIIIDKNCVIKNGQHRLKATVVADYTWQVPLITEVDPDVMQTIDTGKSRSLSDVLTLSGYSQAAALAAITKRILNHKSGANSDSGSNKISHSYAMSFIQDNYTWLGDLVKEARRLYTEQTTNIFTAGDFGLYMYVIAGHLKAFDSDHLRNFMSHLSGKKADESSGGTWLRRKAEKAKNSKLQLNRVWKLGICIKAWNAHVEGLPVTYLKYDMNNPLPKVVKQEV